MSIPSCVKAILDKPGIYKYSTDVLFFFIEVDDKGNVHQLMPATLERDGILSPEGWLIECEETTVTPLDEKEW